MSGVQATEFQQHFATAQFTEADAAAGLTVPGEIVSLGARRGSPDLFVVAFASRNGRVGPFVLNRLVAEQLHQLLAQEGF